MRLLMTRPEPDANRSAERLSARGHTVLVSPVMETRMSGEPLSWQDGTDIAVTSRNGLRALSRLASSRMRVRARLFAVGDATAALAREAGFATVLSAAGALDELLSLIARENPRRLLYVCGRERTEGFEAGLAECAIPLDIAERYAVDPAPSFSAPALAALRAGTLDGALFYSTRTAQAFLALMEHHSISYSTNNMIYFCLAKTISSVFDRKGGARIVVASRPDERSLFEAIDASS